MSPPRAVLAALALALAGCGGDEQPSPGLAERYDVVIAVCADRLPSVTDICDRLTESSGNRVVANVIFGNAGGHEVTVRTEVTEGGDAVDEQPASTVPENRSWLHGVEINRRQACTAPECTLVVRAIIDGQEVANQEFRFVAP